MEYIVKYFEHYVFLNLYKSELMNKGMQVDITVTKSKIKALDFRESCSSENNVGLINMRWNILKIHEIF